MLTSFRMRNYYTIRQVLLSLLFLGLFSSNGWCQQSQLPGLTAALTAPNPLDSFFTHSASWRGADGAASVDLGKGRVLWLFSDTFIAPDSSGSRQQAVMIRNSIAIQDGYTYATGKPAYHWKQTQGKPDDFFKGKENYWYWTGHGSMVKDRLLVFLMKVNAVTGGLGFEVSGWAAALISNPAAPPDQWQMRLIEGGDTYGLIAGSAAVLTDQQWVYAYGAVEPATHEVFLVRWPLAAAYDGNLEQPDWWIADHWTKRNRSAPTPKPLFIGATEFSVHYDKALKQYVQVQAYGFGAASIGIRLADHPQGPWSAPRMLYEPVLEGIRQPFVYSAKAHPEQRGDGLCITYNVNSFDFNEVLQNQSIYFPKTIWVRLSKR